MRGIKRKKEKRYLSPNLNSLFFQIMCPFHYFHIDHNAPCFVPPSSTPRILHNHCFQFHLGITVVPKEIHDNDYTKFWEVNKVHYDLCENGESGGCRPTSRSTVARNIGPYMVCVHVWVKCRLLYWPSSIILSVEYWLSVSWQIKTLVTAVTRMTWVTRMT